MLKYIDAAVVKGRKNLDGRLAVSAAAGLPFLLREGIQVHFVPPVVDAPRTASVESVAMQGEASAVVSFPEVRGADVADMLVGCHCLVAERDADPEALAEAREAAVPALLGWTFEDAASGETGRVTGVQEMPGQVLLTVSLDGSGRECLVPLAEELVVRRDEVAMRLALDLPAGIFDL